jgi:hypothetical protein
VSQRPVESSVALDLARTVNLAGISCEDDEIDLVK